MRPHQLTKPFVFALCSLFALAAAARQPALDKLTLPEGFKIALYADDVPNARALALGERGTVFVGSRSEGKVYALRDEDGDQVAEKRWVLADGLHFPTGIDIYQGDLYVAVVDKILRFDDIEQHLDAPPKPVLVTDKLPNKHGHEWRYIGFGPDNKLYVAIGAPCNICDIGDQWFGRMLRMQPDGSNIEVVAKGIRNSVGFDWHPRTQQQWFSDNGRDWLGDDIPPCELNRIDAVGQDFGYPYCHGGKISDPEFGDLGRCEDSAKPAWNFSAHTAPLGVRFYTGKMFPDAYQQQLFVAQHGSWNRTQPIGYQVMSIILAADGKTVKKAEPFITGWLGENNQVYGRPVDMLVMPDGAMLVSDDYTGVVYRVSYQAQ